MPSGRALYRQRIIQSLTIGSALGTLAGAAAVAAAIAGLAGSRPWNALAIGCGAAGVGLVTTGIGEQRAYRAMISREGGRTQSRMEIGGSVLIAILGGLIGVFLATPFLLGRVSPELIPLGVLIMGITLVFGSSVTGHVNDLVREDTAGTMTRAEWVQLLLGLVTFGCGTLSVRGTATLTLSLLGVLALGIANLLTGAVVEAVLFPARH